MIGRSALNELRLLWTQFRRGELLWVAAGQLGSVIGVGVGVRVITGLIEPTVYGEVALDITVATLLAQVALGPVGHASERFFASAAEAGNVNTFVHALRHQLRRATLIVLACGAGLAICASVVAPEQAPAFGLAATVFALLSGIENVFDSTQNAARQRVVVALHQALRSWLRPLMIAGMVLSLGPTSVAAILGYTLATIAVLMSQMAAFRRHLKQHSERHKPESRAELHRDMDQYAAPFAVWGLLAWVQASSDRWSLQIFKSSDQVGLYAVVYQLGAYPIAILFSMVGQLVAPIVFARAGDASDRTRVEIALRWVAFCAAGLLLIGFACALTAFVGHAIIFGLLVAPDYASVSYLLPLAVLASALLNVGHVIGWTALVLRRPKALLVSRVGSALLTVLLNGAGAALLGLPAVLASAVLAAAAYCLWTTIACVRALRSFFRRAVVEKD